MTIATEQLSPARVDRLFFTAMSVACLLTVLVGFAPTYFLRSSALIPLNPLYHLHGLIFTAWICLFVGQTVLVAAHRTEIHRQLGYGGVVLAAAVVVIGLVVAIETLRGGFGATLLRAFGTTRDPISFFAIPIADILPFGVLVALAVVLRKHADAHKRLMLLATISLLPAAIVRLGTGREGAYIGTDLFVAALVFYDVVSCRRVHPASLWGGMLVVVFKPWLLYMVSTTAAWMAFVNTLR